MKTCLFFLCFLLTVINSNAQTNTNNFVEGGKLLVELVKIFKKKPVPQSQLGHESNSSDLCFTNSTADNLFIELSKKISDTGYKILPSAISLTPNSHECLLELVPAIYHYRVYKKSGAIQALSLEGELRLKPDEKMEREIK